MEVKTIEEVKIKVAEEMQKRWLDLSQIKGWLNGHKGIPQEAQEQIAEQIKALFAEYGLRPDLGHIVVLGDRPYVTREGLLYYARKSGQLQGIKVEIVERQKDFCLVKATVLTKDGGEFEAYGDASTSNTNRMVSPHLIRMAETRAINRALREAFPIGLCSYEELGEADIDISVEPATGEPNPTPSSSSSPAKASNGGVSKKQIGFMKKLLKEVFGENAEEEGKRMIAVYGKSSSKELTSKEASEIIDTLKKLKENKEKKEEGGEHDYDFE